MYGTHLLQALLQPLHFLFGTLQLVLLLGQFLRKPFDLLILHLIGRRGLALASLGLLVGGRSSGASGGCTLHGFGSPIVGIYQLGLLGLELRFDLGQLLL